MRSGIFTLVSFNKLSARAAYTANFFKNFNDLFDVFNRIKFNEPIVLTIVLTKKFLHWDFFKEALIFLSELKINNKRGSLPPCIIGWQKILFLYKCCLKN